MESDSFKYLYIRYNSRRSTVYCIDVRFICHIIVPLACHSFVIVCFKVENEGKYRMRKGVIVK